MKIELWLGEDDSRQSALHLFANPAKVAKDLLAVATANEGLTGFNETWRRRIARPPTRSSQCRSCAR